MSQVSITAMTKKVHKSGTQTIGTPEYTLIQNARSKLVIVSEAIWPKYAIFSTIDLLRYQEFQKK